MESSIMISRRRLLQASAIPAIGFASGTVGLGALMVADARPARALSFEQAADAVSAQYLKARACLHAPNAYHHQLADEVRAMLRERDIAVSDEDIRLAVARTICPLCGCPLEA